MINLSIEITGGKNLGRCYDATYYKIKSLNRPLPDATILALRELGFLGYGQEFSFTRAPEEPADVDKWNTFYVVTAVDRADSSD